MLLIVGEVIVDYTYRSLTRECKLRLGGIIHAARGLWASGIEYSVAAICPGYLVEQAKKYLKQHGCTSIIWIGDVIGSPNVMLIGDPCEVSNQEYELLLRDEKTVKLMDDEGELKKYRDILIFPGRFDLLSFRNRFGINVQFSFDLAYDIDDMSLLSSYVGNIASIIISTSSELFLKEWSKNVEGLVAKMRSLGAKYLLLKENRGGSRLFDLENNAVENIPASLGKTVNSVGVGDVYTAVMVGQSNNGWINAAWRGSRAATYYSRTTYIDDFKRDVLRDQGIQFEILRNLGGTFLPWHSRKKFSIYLAAPDFSTIERDYIDLVIKALEYHNFNLRRPVQEFGELNKESDISEMHTVFVKDYELLMECNAVFAVPLSKDPGTVCEIGIAISCNKPVITFDPKHENANTMIVAGSTIYSSDLDVCLNALFVEISKML